VSGDDQPGGRWMHAADPVCKLRPLEDVRPRNPTCDAIGAAPKPPYAAGIRRPSIMFGSCNSIAAAFSNAVLRLPR